MNGQRRPDGQCKVDAPGFVILPDRLTAENGAKAALMGERYAGELVSWSAIKEVHRAVVELFAAAPAGSGAVDATEYARKLAVAMHAAHYAGESPDWESCPDLVGILSQIDNMLTGLTRHPPPAASEVAKPQVIFDFTDTDTPPAAVSDTTPLDDLARLEAMLSAYNKADYQWTKLSDPDEPRHRYAMRAALEAIG